MFEHVKCICSARAVELNPPPCTYPTESWKRAHVDLDAIHRQGDAYFIGHKYLLHSTTVKLGEHVLCYDFLLQRVNTAERWKPLCVCYLNTEDSPCEADEDYLPEPDEVYCEYEGRCSNCQQDAPRNCSECGIGICDGCSFGKTLCKHCMMDHGLM